ncbi:hypothetical protein LCGC14_2439530 [marine sediment metagenome]|uniref:Uncharacterized protein n=1 Tax=marine sediment metagenome TaxID=412755 RepID=A0A0F9EDC8_9ZZZZ
MRMHNLVNPDTVSPPLPIIPTNKWVLLDSDVLGERIVVIRDKRWLMEAQQAHPGLVIYFPQEIKNLERFKGSDDDIRVIHKAKKRWKAWIIRSQI